MKFRIAYFAIVCFFVASCSESPTSTTDQQFGRYAHEGEIVGFWELVPLPANVFDILNKVNPWPLPFQWFAIYEDGRMYTVMATEDENLSSDALHRTFQDFPFSLQYEFRSGFLKVTDPQIENHAEHWAVNIMLRDGSVADVVPVNEGDLILSLQGSREDEVVYYRHLRRLE